MKITISLALASLLLVITVKATIRTINNSPAPILPGMYTNINAAMSASSDGDTIYLEGTNINYGSITVLKRLTFIGTGYKPTSQFGFTSQLGDITVSTTSSSGSKFLGLTFGWIWGINSDNILITRCKFYQIRDMGSNWIIEKNVGLVMIDIGAHFGTIISHNVISGPIRYSDKANVVIINNVFHNTNATQQAFFGVSNANISNNIFYGGITANGASYCIFGNNLAYPIPVDTSTFFNYSTNITTGNVFGDPKFTLIVDNFVSINNDYRLLAGSPAINEGSDGTDIGLTGGVSPFFIDIHGMPPIPQITKVVILTPSIIAGDSLKINVKARVQE